MARAGRDKANGDTTRNRHVERAGEDEGGRWWEIRCTKPLYASSNDARGRFHQQRVHLRDPRGTCRTCRTCSTKVAWPVLLLLSYRGNYLSLHRHSAVDGRVVTGQTVFLPFSYETVFNLVLGQDLKLTPFLFSFLFATLSVSILLIRCFVIFFPSCYVLLSWRTTRKRLWLWIVQW